MKKLLIACIFLTSQSFAASTGTLYLKGTVGINYNITVTPEPSAILLDIVNGESLKLVGVATEYTNNPNGYKITASSANNGFLKNGTLDSVAYQMSYNNGSLTSLTSTAVTVKTSTSHAVGGITSNIKVSFTGKSSALAGDYTDTVTLSIQAP